MFHPFKRLERSWNAHTPKFLHNGTKENIIFQLTLTVLMLLGFYAKDKVEERRQKRQEAAESPNNTYYLSDYAGQR